MLAPRFPRSRFGKAVALIASGTALSQLLGVALMPLLTRLFTPEAFGVLAVYASLLMTFKVVIGLRYEMAIPLAVSDEEAVSLMGATFATMIVLLGSGTAIAWALLPWLYGFERFESARSVIWLVPVGLLAAGSYQTLRLWAIRDRLYGAIAGTTVSQGVGRSVVQMASGFTYAVPAGLIVGEIIGHSAGVVRLARAAWAKVKVHHQALKPKRLWSVARAYIGFPLLQAPSSLLNSAGMQLPALLLASCYGASVAGIYFVAQRLLGAPVQLISNAMGQVFLGEVAQLARDNPQELASRFNAITRRLLISGLAPAVLLMIFAPWGAIVLLGEEWGEVGHYVQWLTLSLLLKFSYDGLINLAIVQRHDYALAWASIRLILVAVSVLAAYALEMPPVAAVGAISGAFSSGYLLKLLLWKRAIRQLIIRHNREECVKD